VLERVEHRVTERGVTDSARPEKSRSAATRRALSAFANSRNAFENERKKEKSNHASIPDGFSAIDR